MEGYELFVSVGPNPRVARMYAAERGLTLAETEVDIGAGENRRPPYRDLNPSGDTPALRRPDGSVLAEATVICEHLEELSGPSSLIGETAAARAKTRMWVRRIDLKVVQPFTGGFRYGPALPFFQPRVHCIPQASDDLFEIAREGLEWLEAQVSEQPYVVGETFTLADIVLFCFLDFNKERVGRPMTNGLSWISAWFDRVAERPSAAATRR
ncbi:glutathione S-transferase family protein [Phenylobacterium sp.]|jgi:glutathione S-transferase|uniref:glutathione S-transferase family protein n=1 Tax=Phenylobacterium sp. TaxID=1871053 RepID=UPI002F3F4D7F